MASPQFRPLYGAPSAKPIMHVSDDDAFVRPRPGGSRLLENRVTFESTFRVKMVFLAIFIGVGVS